MKNKCLLVGAGSVGKHHAKTLENIFTSITIVDPDQNSLEWCRKNLSSELQLFSDIDKMLNKLDNLKHYVCIIANWGIDHYDTLIKLINKNADAFYVEKPFVNSLLKIDNIKKISVEKKLNIISGYIFSHSDLNHKINEIANNHLGGLPTSIVVEGGACCIVTNGIHFLDFAIKLFGSNPVEVYMNVQDDKINPRSKKLGFWEGVAFWKFNKNQKVTIAFNNNSSVALTCNLYCPRGIIKIYDGKLSILKRNDDEVKSDPRMVRTGKVFEVDKEKEIQIKFLPETSIPLFNILKSEKEIVDLNSQTIAAESIIAGLISNEFDSTIKLPVESSNKFYSYDWNIS